MVNTQDLIINMGTYCLKYVHLIYHPPVDDVLKHEAGKVCVEPLVAANELVGEGESGHEAALLQPEDGGERAGEKDALHARVGNHALSEGGAPKRSMIVKLELFEMKEKCRITAPLSEGQWKLCRPKGHIMPHILQPEGA